eukprot:scaffold8981_cov20-Tisochrysis_lutea.AAC.1
MPIGKLRLPEYARVLPSKHLAAMQKEMRNKTYAQWGTFAHGWGAHWSNVGRGGAHNGPCALQKVRKLQPVFGRGVHDGLFIHLWNTCNAWLADSVIRGIDGKEKSTPAKRFRALRKGSLTSKLARVSPKGPQT